MHKIVLIGIAIVILIVGIVIGIRFYNNNLSGALVAINPKGNIAELFVSPTPSQSFTENKTQFPLRMPQGFTISLFAQKLGNPRVLTKDPIGTLLVSIPNDSRIVALPDDNSDGKADKIITVASGLNRPHGLAFSCTQNTCNLYVAETDKVSVFNYDTQTKIATSRRNIIELPSGGNHWSRTVIVHQDKLYVSIGSSCNVCEEADNRRAKIFVANLDGSDFKEFASGLRNSVFMAIHPITNEIWATDMGRDLLGDDIPNEEVNIIKEGKNYGWPFCYQDQVQDKKFDPSPQRAQFCTTTQKPHIKMQAHSAPLGLAFVPDSWGEDYANSLLVAYHGSWNRSTPTGYKIARMKLDKNGNFGKEEDFITGWLQGKEALGRPVDILLDDKKGFISDDAAGVIYLLEYKQ